LKEECAGHDDHDAAGDRDALSSGGKILVRIFFERIEAVEEMYEHEEVQKEVQFVAVDLVREHQDQHHKRLDHQNSGVHLVKRLGFDTEQNLVLMS